MYNFRRWTRYTISLNNFFYQWNRAGWFIQIMTRYFFLQEHNKNITILSASFADVFRYVYNSFAFHYYFYMKLLFLISLKLLLVVKIPMSYSMFFRDKMVFNFICLFRKLKRVFLKNGYTCYVTVVPDHHSNIPVILTWFWFVTCVKSYWSQINVTHFSFCEFTWIKAENCISQLNSLARPWLSLTCFFDFKGSSHKEKFQYLLQVMSICLSKCTHAKKQTNLLLW
jgi:hypothetical protein